MIEINWFLLIAVGVTVGMIALLGARSSLARILALNVRLNELQDLLDAEKDRSEALQGKLNTIADSLGVHAQQLDSLQRRQERMEIQPGGRAFDEAISMIERGASQDSLVSSFGLSEGEADLVTRMHRRRPGP